MPRRGVAGVRRGVAWRGVGMIPEMRTPFIKGLIVMEHGRVSYRIR